MEEGGSLPAADADAPGDDRWIVDPLDGTTNFLHGVPHFAISIAHEENRQVVAGVVYQPLTDELFWAVRGTGAFLNHRRMRVSSRGTMADALLATGLPYRGKPKHPAYGRRWRRSCRKSPACAASCGGARSRLGRRRPLRRLLGVRSGALDVAAGLLLVREAGGSVSDVAGRDRAWAGAEVLASNTALHGDLRRLVGDAVRGAEDSGK